MKTRIIRRPRQGILVATVLTSTLAIAPWATSPLKATLGDGVSGDFLLDNGIFRLGKLESPDCEETENGCSHPDSTSTRMTESVAIDGRMNAPMLGFTDTDNLLKWWPMTNNSWSLDLSIGIGDTGSAWHRNAIIGYSEGYEPFPWDAGQRGSRTSSVAFDSATERAVGSITHSGGRLTMTRDATLEIGTKYEVLAGQPFVRATMTVRNRSASTITNVNAWAGTRDDRIGGDDSPRKIRGNITGTGFAALTDATETSNAVLISNAGDSNPDGTFNVVLFSTAPGSRSVFSNLGTKTVGSNEG